MYTSMVSKTTNCSDELYLIYYMLSAMLLTSE